MSDAGLMLGITRPPARSRLMTGSVSRVGCKPLLCGVRAMSCACLHGPSISNSTSSADLAHCSASAPIGAARSTTVSPPLRHFSSTGLRTLLPPRFNTCVWIIVVFTSMCPALFEVLRIEGNHFSPERVDEVHESVALQQCTRDPLFSTVVIR